MGTITTVDVANGTATDAGIINGNFSAIKTVVNGNIDNANIAPDADIAVTKIAPSSTDNDVLTTVAGVVTWQAPAASGGGGTDIPVGVGMDYWGNTAPTGWLFADGSAISRTTYADLFAVMGVSFGAGDGSTTFNLPDKRGRVSVGKGTHSSVDTLGENDGVTVTNRRPHHRHTTSGGHVHTFQVFGSGGTGGAGNHTDAGFTVGVSTSDPLDAPAHIVCNYIVFTGV